MATFTKINDFILNLPHGEFLFANAGGNQLELALTNTAPVSETSDPTDTGNGILANLTELAGPYTNYSDDLAVDRNLTKANITSAISGAAGAAVWKLDYTADIIITASGGAMGTFRYIYLWDDDSTTPTDSLIGVWDHGSGITLASTETATLAWNASGILTLT